MELIADNKDIECDSCGNEINLAIKFLNKSCENEDVVICNHCIENGTQLIAKTYENGNML